MVDVEVTLNKKLIINAQNTILRDSLPFNFRNDLTRNHHINATQGHLILSSSAGSVVALSSSLYASGSSHSITGTFRIDPNIDLSNAGSSYHVRAVNSYLILSSSAGSQVTISGNFSIIGSGTLGPTFDAALNYPTSSLTIHGGTATSSLGHEKSVISFFNQQEGTSWSQIATFTLGRWRLNGTAPESSLDINLKNAASAADTADVTAMRLQSNGNVRISGALDSLVQHLILSSSAGSQVTLSGTLGIRGLQDDTGINMINDESRSLKIRDALGNIIMSLSSSAASARSRVGIATTTPDHFAALDIGGTAGALIVPRLTNAQKDALTGVAGMVIYSTTSGSFLFYNTSWKIVTIV